MRLRRWIPGLAVVAIVAGCAGPSHSSVATSGITGGGVGSGAAAPSSVSAGAATPSLDPTATVALSSIDACALLPLASARDVLGPDAALPTPTAAPTSDPDDGAVCSYATPAVAGTNGVEALSLAVFDTKGSATLASRDVWLQGIASSPFCHGGSDRPAQSDPLHTDCTFAPITVARVLEGGQNLADTVYPGTPTTVGRGTTLLWWQGGLVFELSAVVTNGEPVDLSAVATLADRIAVDVG